MSASTTFRKGLPAVFDFDDPVGSRALEVVLFRDLNEITLPKEAKRRQEKGATAEVIKSSATLEFILVVTYPRALKDPPPSFEEIHAATSRRINGVASEWRDCKLFVEALRLKREMVVSGRDGR